MAKVQSAKRFGNTLTVVVDSEQKNEDQKPITESYDFLIPAAFPTEEEWLKNHIEEARLLTETKFPTTPSIQEENLSHLIEESNA